MISPSVRELILERDPALSPDRIVYVPNPTNESLFRPVQEIRERYSTDVDPDFFTLMYAGAIGDVQGFDTLLDAAALLRDEPRIRIRMAGDGIARKRLEAKAASKNLRNIEFVGRVQQHQVPIEMSKADAQLVSLAESEFLKYTTPSKISTILASAIPVVAQISGDGANLLSESGAALVTPPGDAPALAETISQMARKSLTERTQMATRGRKYYIDNLSVSKVSDVIIKSLGGN